MIHPITLSYRHFLKYGEEIRHISKDMCTRTQESSANNCVCLVVTCRYLSIPCYQALTIDRTYRLMSGLCCPMKLSWLVSVVEECVITAKATYLRKVGSVRKACEN